MPSDIRSFFGGRGDQTPSQEHAPKQDTSIDHKKRRRGKRKILSDSEDEGKLQSTEEPIRKRMPQGKQRRRDSLEGEITTTSEYFASSGKAIPSRSTPTKSKTSSETGQLPCSLKLNCTKGTPIAKENLPESISKSRTSSRKKRKSDYVVSSDGEHGGNDDDFTTKIINNDNLSDHDMFGVDYKYNQNDTKDEYKNDKDEDREQQLIPRTINNCEGTHQAPQLKLNRNVTTRPKTVNEKEPKDCRVLVDRQTASHSRKRKTTALAIGNDEEKDNEEISSPPTKKTNAMEAKASLSSHIASLKKGSSPIVKGDRPEGSKVKDILKSIPTIRPPTPPARDESKKFDFRAAGQRSQPIPAAASKQVPSGADNCLAGLSFVFTGLLKGLARDEGIELVKRYGGKVTTTPSSRTSFVILGNDAGPKKLETIAKFGLQVIDEDGLFELIRRLPANGGDGKAAEKAEEKKKQEEKQAAKLSEEMDKHDKLARREAAAKSTAVASNSVKEVGLDKQHTAPFVDARLWTVKYAPTTASMICGNKTQVDKLQAWLRAWPSNSRTKFKKAGKDGHGTFRAIMIHGPPGIGKTTAAHLAARLEGYDIVESNASDTRSKKLIETGLRGVLDTTSVLGYFAADGEKVEAGKKKLVLIMDEVDGMSAGDRGGVGALAAICKKTNIPMILICNDRRLPKMKPFDSVTYDLQFRKPTVDQIRSRIMTICYREGLKVPANVINALIEGSRSDIRQIINMLSTAKINQSGIDFDQSKKISKSWEKHVILKPWDIVSQILGGGMFAQSSTVTLNDKIELYFNDHEFSSLMLQENYLGTNPILSHTYSGKEKVLRLLELTDKAAESISDGDLVDRMIHGSQQHWSLMPTQAVFSFVRPASFVSGSLAHHQTRFTSWLGNNSKYGKLMRFLKEIYAHMRLRASGDRHEIREQYFSVIWYKLVKNLEKHGKDGVERVIDLMDSYFLTKDDWDAILELAVGPIAMETIKIETQTKASFTRLYNLQSHPLPFMKANSAAAPKKLTKDKPDLEEALEGSDGEDPASDMETDDGREDNDALDLKKDKYVKAPKNKTVSKKSNVKKASSKARGKGKSKGESRDVSEEECADGVDDSEEDSNTIKQKRKASTSRGRPRK